MSRIALRRSVIRSAAALAFFGSAACQPAPDRSSATEAPAPQATQVVSAQPAPGPAPKGMVWVPGGTFAMGCETCNMPDTTPVHQVSVDGFWMDETPVTNAQFAEFVKATGYVTVAERPLDPRDFPGVEPSKLVPGSAVFVAPPKPVSLHNHLEWWRYMPGANWRHPGGPETTIEGLDEHPVVHVAFADAVAYLDWRGERLPTEAEYEFAARGGLDRAHYAWGNDLKPEGRWAANVFQGTFPSTNAVEDGFRGSSPVRAFKPNGYGLYDMGGNVWQWSADWYRADTYERRAASGKTEHNPLGPSEGFDPAEPQAAKRVVRGGSFLCSEEYCTRYLVGSRGKAEVSSGAANLGFRGVRAAVR